VERPFKVFTQLPGSQEYLASVPLSYQDLIQQLSVSIGMQMQGGPKTVGLHYNGDYVSGRECVKLFKASQECILQQPVYGARYQRDVAAFSDTLPTLASFYCSLLSEYAFHAADTTLWKAKQYNPKLRTSYSDVYGWWFAAYVTLFVHAIDEFGFGAESALRIWDTLAHHVCPAIKRRYASRWVELLEHDIISSGTEEVKDALLYKFFVSQTMEHLFEGFLLKDLTRLEISPIAFQFESEELGIALPCTQEQFLALSLAIFSHEELEGTRRPAFTDVAGFYSEFVRFFHAFSLDLAFRLLQRPIPLHFPAETPSAWEPLFLGAAYRFRL
jgi:hypothetical protein